MRAKIIVICVVAFSVLLLFSLYFVFSLKTDGQSSVLPKSVSLDPVLPEEMFIPEGMSKEEQEEVKQIYLKTGMSKEEAKQIYLKGQAELKQIEASADDFYEEFSKMTSEEKVEAYQRLIDDWESLIPEMEANGTPTGIPVEWYRDHVATLKRYKKSEEGAPERREKWEQIRREIEEAREKANTWTLEMIEILSPIAHFEIEEIDGRIEIISWEPNHDALQQRKLEQDTAKPEEVSPISSVTAEPEMRPQTEDPVSSLATPDDPVKLLSSAQASLRSWRADFDNKYFDVVISQYFTQQELEQYFRTAEDREQLKSRRTAAQKEVVFKIRDLVKEVPDVKQKREITRELVTANFDKDFADTVLKALENDAD